MRKYPDFVEDFVPFISKIGLEQIEDIEGKTGFVWILGAFCEQIPEAPYMIEKFLKDMTELDSPEFSIILLISTFRMFFKRAPETKHILAGLFKEIMTNSTDTDLK
jgi:hypothetical protein